MNKEKELAENLIDFIYESPTAFHAVESIKTVLKEKGFLEIKEEEKWEIQKGGRYFATRNESALIAFIAGTGIPAENGFKIIAGHTDSPGFRVKPLPEIAAEGKYIKLNTEVYGGPILNTWMDRPLSLAGRVIIKGKNVLYPETVLINIRRPILIIPNVAIHMNREVNKGVELNKQTDILPLLCMVKDNLEKDGLLLKIIAEELKLAVEDIMDFDLFLYEYEKGSITGFEKEFISSSRLDDLETLHAGITAIVNSDASEALNMLACFDNEEVGSSTKQGADSGFLADILERIVISFGGNREDFFRAQSRSFMISADSAHAVHPNKSEKSDPTNRPFINDGPVIKISANQKYTSDSSSIAVYETICKNSGIPVQKFVNRSDETGGSTLGPISATHLSVRSVDIGTPILAMHSIRELCGVRDHSYLEKSFEEFYKL